MKNKLHTLLLLIAAFVVVSLTGCIDDIFLH